MTISEKAAQKLKDDLIRRFLNTGLGFRLASDGNQHISIGLDRQGADDKVMEAGGIRILVDSSVAALLARCDLDYVDGPGGGFCLKDPGVVKMADPVQKKMVRVSSSRKR